MDADHGLIKKQPEAPQRIRPEIADKGATLIRLIGLLEDDDDVQNVYANYDMSEEDLAKLDA